MDFFLNDIDFIVRQKVRKISCRLKCYYGFKIALCKTPRWEGSLSLAEIAQKASDDLQDQTSRNAVNEEIVVERPVDFINAIAKAESINDILSIIAKWSQTVFDGERASITLTDTPTHLKLIAVEGNQAVPIDMPIPIEGTVVGRVYKLMRGEICPDLFASDELDCVMLREKGLGSFMDVPLVSGSKCYGTMNVGHVEKHAFTDADMKRMQAMAHWIAASIRIHHQIEQMTLLSETDPLTGIYNRRAFTQRFNNMVGRWKSGASSLGIAVLDLDHFKDINDTHGHDAGDKVLVHVGGLLQENFRTGDLIARMGGGRILRHNERYR